MGDARDQADPGAGQRDLADVVQQTGRADVGRETDRNRLLINGDQVALIVRMQPLEQPVNVFVWQESGIYVGCRAKYQGKPDLVQAMNDRVVRGRCQVKEVNHPRSQRTRSSRRLYPGPISSL